MEKIKVGYLPLFVKLYDDDDPHYRDPLVEHMNKLISLLEKEGIEIVLADEVCRLKDEFRRAADKFNSLGVDAVITQHLAYSPSLESVEALVSLKAPIIVFDTTVDCEFIRYADEKPLMRANHGIHGVQDMCNLLTRNGKKYRLCVGHPDNSDVIKEVADMCRSAAIAKKFRTEKIGSAAGSFAGMGDFVVSSERYKKEIGAEIVELKPSVAKRYLDSVTETEIDAELADDAKNYKNIVTDVKAYREGTRNGLALRKWMSDNGLDACSVNFLNLTDCGLTAMPFIECSKQLANGKGYAGEGDTLTAGLVGALMSVYPDTTFVEMFCPDWEKDVIFFSHMGEMNPRLAQWKPSLVDCPMGGDTGENTAYVIGCCAPGKAVYVNLAPMARGYRLIISEAEMLDIGKETNIYNDYRNQGWMKPCKPVREFLRDFSEVGGTHHSALVYNGDVNVIANFGKMMGFEVIIIK